MTARVDGLAHIGVAVGDLVQAEAALLALGGASGGREIVEDEGVEVSFVTFGDLHVELLRPLDPDAEGGVAGFLRRRGPGVHHVALDTQDVDGLLLQLLATGVAPIGGASRPGAKGSRVAFLHPRDTGGILIELCEVKA